MKSIAIVAGGNLSKELLSNITAQDIIIGVDRGAWWLITNSIIPQYAVGDFDSVFPEELQKIKDTSPNVVQYKPEKDETDLEIALKLAISLKPKGIRVFGGFGSRMDHSLVGIFLLESVTDVDIVLVDENNELSVITSKKEIHKNPLFPYCSIIPITKTAEVSLQGFKYPLSHGVLRRDKTLGVSNELIKSKGLVTVHEGKVFCIQSRG